eukprot:TRINITY_DN65751_c0_g1_i1.p1 TRINITY_DN65751_c0_g1~~TRINITY_DN65751_c0_g1_i1.p1  ORF type:complete len:481 (-),score=71.31 TRINITY_DN65751_c0_g1_i1:100-1503(-)
MASEEATLNSLIWKHLQLAGLSEECLDKVHEQLSSETAARAAPSDLSRLYAHAQDGSLRVVVKEMTGKEHSLAVNSSMSVADLKHALAKDHGPPSKRQRLVYGNTVLANSQTIASCMLSPLSAHITLVQVADSKLYVFGGYQNTTGETDHENSADESDQPMCQAAVGEIYDLCSGLWTDLPEGEDQPDTEDFFDEPGLSVAVYRDAIYMIGWEQYDRRCVVFKPIQNVWRFGPFLPEILSKGDDDDPGKNRLVALDDKLFVVSDTDRPMPEGTRTQRMVYELYGESWEHLTTVDARSSGASCVATGGKLYAIGGFSRIDDENRSSNVVESYDLRNNAWSSQQPMKVARANASVVVFEDKIFVFGGKSTTVRENAETGECTVISDEVLSSCEVYDPAVNRWTDIADMPTAREEIQAAVCNQDIHVIGGSVADIATRTVDIYNPKTSEWTSGTPMRHCRADCRVVVVQG